MAQANVKLTVDATSATRALQGVQNQTNQLQKSFGGLKTAIAGIGFTVLAKQTISTTANFRTLQLRMKGLTSEYGEFAQVQELVTKAQNKFNLSIVEATKSVTDIFARLRPLGIELRDIETAFMGFYTCCCCWQNANEMNATFTQLTGVWVLGSFKVMNLEVLQNKYHNFYQLFQKKLVLQKEN